MGGHDNCFMLTPILFGFRVLGALRVFGEGEDFCHLAELTKHLLMNFRAKQKKPITQNIKQNKKNAKI